MLFLSSVLFILLFNYSLRLQNIHSAVSWCKQSYISTLKCFLNQALWDKHRCLETFEMTRIMSDEHVLFIHTLENGRCFSLEELTFCKGFKRIYLYRRPIPKYLSLPRRPWGIKFYLGTCVCTNFLLSAST